eukprot:5841042-Prymnesium_polylepis.1
MHLHVPRDASIAVNAENELRVRVVGVCLCVESTRSSSPLYGSAVRAYFSHKSQYSTQRRSPLTAPSHCPPPTAPSAPNRADYFFV